MKIRIKSLVIPSTKSKFIVAVSDRGNLTEDGYTPKVITPYARFVYYSDHTIAVYDHDTSTVLTATLSEIVLINASEDPHYTLSIRGVNYSFRVTNEDTLDGTIAALGRDPILLDTWLYYRPIDPFFYVLLHSIQRYWPENLKEDRSGDGMAKFAFMFLAVILILGAIIAGLGTFPRGNYVIGIIVVSMFLIPGICIPLYVRRNTRTHSTGVVVPRPRRRAYPLLYTIAAITLASAFMLSKAHGVLSPTDAMVLTYTSGALFFWCAVVAFYQQRIKNRYLFTSVDHRLKRYNRLWWVALFFLVTMFVAPFIFVTFPI